LSRIQQSTSAAAPSKDQTRKATERIEAERIARRQALSDLKCQRAEEEKRIRDAGNPGDVNFVGLVQRWRESRVGTALPYYTSGSGSNDVPSSKICISVRKRPINDKEYSKKDHDSVTVVNPSVYVHVPKYRVDGINKYLDHSSFCFDYAFDEDVATKDVYMCTALPLVQNVIKGDGCRATVFAYGQTGSGKTHTMSGIQGMVAADLFYLLSGKATVKSSCTRQNTIVTVSFFEIYGVRIQDLLNSRHQLKLLEDGRGEVVIFGLEEYETTDAEHLFSLITQGNSKRTTHATEANDTSSRSHSICQIMLRDRESKRLRGKLSLVDLAGSERGADTKSHDRQRQTESSEINKSLLALKECIRALDAGSSHVPYRGSKLTLVLKDCFTSSRAWTAMIATVSPASSSIDHTLNTLRYADRVKEKKIGNDSLPYKVSTEKNRAVHTSCHDLQGGNGNSVEDEHKQSMSAQKMLYQNTTIENLQEIENVSSYESNEDEKQGDRFEETVDIWGTHEYNEGAFREESEQLINLHIRTIQ